MVRRRLEIEDPRRAERRAKRMFRIKTAVIIFVIVLILLFVYLGVTYFDSLSAWVRSSDGSPKKLPPFESVEQTFKKFAVCSDAPPCSTAGKEILEKNGSVVDAAIAAMLCNGIYNAHSTGLGGGFQMVIFKNDTKEVSVLDARETAPLLSNKTMFVNQTDKAKRGALASGVPGELAGYWTAWEKFGKLPWVELFDPVKRLCATGYKLSPSQYSAMNFNETSFRQNPIFVEQFVDPVTNKFKAVGDQITPNPQLCKTLETIAAKSPTEFYQGPIGQKFVQDVQSMGGIITMDDLRNYTAEWRKPAKVTLHSGENIYSSPPPGSGLLLVHIIKIMDMYQLSMADIELKSRQIESWHRMIEAFKFAFAKRTKLGDPKFVDVTQLVSDLQSEAYANETYNKIIDDKTFVDPAHYGATDVGKNDPGTAHISVVAPNGDAVSVTATINLYFGAHVTSKQTGIILNSGMDDFSTPGLINYFNLPPIETNYIEPGKRSISSTCPTIIVSEDGNVRMVIGASGGTKIPTGLSQVIYRHLWLDAGIKEAIDIPRFHHQLIPMKVGYEPNMSEDIIKGLRTMGHQVELDTNLAIMCAIVKVDDEIIANADYRKRGSADGI